MSNFLSNFEPKDYEHAKKSKHVAETKTSSEIREKSEESETESEKGGWEEKPVLLQNESVPTRSTLHEEEESEFDPKFKKRKRDKQLVILVLFLVLIMVSSVIFYQVTYVTMPDFKNKALADAQQWAAKNKMKVETASEFSLEISRNEVIKQDKKAEQKVKKGSTIEFTVSKGADPEAKIPLPEFEKMSESEAKDWLDSQQVENVTVISEYDEKIEKNKFLRMELSGDLTKENFKRGDHGKVYFSKGKEVYQKNIVVPDFNEKTRVDVENWAKNNEIELEIKKVSSDSIESGLATSQSIAPKEKIEKKTKLLVEVSAGKGILVPDFTELTPETAQGTSDLQVKVIQKYNAELPYGQLLYQTVDAGTELIKEENTEVIVAYSAGRPYLKDLTGELEGDLQKIFFDEYRSKGANIYYTIRYVKSEEKKGTVVGMSTFNTYVPLEYTVTIDISLGS